MYQEIDYEKLRKDLIDYYGTASQIFPMAIIELSKVEKASPEKLIHIAQNNGLDLSIYTNSSKKTR